MYLRLSQARTDDNKKKEKERRRVQIGNLGTQSHQAKRAALNN